MFLVPKDLLLVVWSSIGLWVVGWVGLWVHSFYFAMGWVGSVVSWVGLGWRNWTPGQLCLGCRSTVSAPINSKDIQTASNIIVSGVNYFFK